MPSAADRGGKLEDVSIISNLLKLEIVFEEFH